MGVFLPLFVESVADGGKPDRLMTDATHMNAPNTAASLLERGLHSYVSGRPKAG